MATRLHILLASPAPFDSFQRRPFAFTGKIDRVVVRFKRHRKPMSRMSNVLIRLAATILALSIVGTRAQAQTEPA